MRYIIAVAIYLVGGWAIAETLEQRVKSSLGELSFGNLALATENETLRARVAELEAKANGGCDAK